MENIKILFVCTHNAARSQIAEAYVNLLGGDKYTAESAGIEPGPGLNPYVVRAMAEDGIDISKNSVDKVFDFFREGRKYHYVVTVCDESQREQCPVFPGLKMRMHWGFSDPSKFEGTDDEIMAQVRTVRDRIKEKVKQFLANPDFKEEVKF
ncbi:MAG: arsenate reductase [Spirochaetes bacterium GWF1_51_8]|nr:MAG: arsenate reductase [Spirochaetes bacterium GWF1_51_8]